MLRFDFDPVESFYWNSRATDSSFRCFCDINFL